MKRYLLALITGVSFVAMGSFLLNTTPIAAQTQPSTAVFGPDGKMKLPTGFRKWVFVGAPLTPNGLNGGTKALEASGRLYFPEYHHIYIEQKNVDAYLKTGSFPEGTVIIKELTRVLNPTFPDGSRTEPSGRGFFNGEYNGIDATVKDSKGLPRPTAGASSLSVIIRCRMPRQLRSLLQTNAPVVTYRMSPKPT